MVFSKQSICPPSEDRNAFLDDAVALACTKLLRSLQAYERNFDIWVVVIAKQAACDHRRFIKRHTPPLSEPIDAIEQQQARPDGGSLKPFSSAYWADPSSLVHERETKDVVNFLLQRHAKKDDLSARVISMVALHEFSLVDTALWLGTYTKRVTRLLQHDYQELRTLLADYLHITRLKDI
jgi:DNA-directed RNA polymerase specialized sigma24 family protein